MATATSSVHSGTVEDQAKTNWLDFDEPEGSAAKWKTVTFKGDMSDRKQRALKEKMVKAYIRGWLELYNDENRTSYKVLDVDIRNNYGEDTRFTVKAFIDAHEEGTSHADGQIGGPIGGTHVVPPPPPDEI